MNAYRTPAKKEPTLTPEEEKYFLEALRPTPWFGRLYLAGWIIVMVAEAILRMLR